MARFVAPLGAPGSRESCRARSFYAIRIQVPRLDVLLSDAVVRMHRESALILEITPPGGETVTRFFMDNPSVPAGAEVTQ